MNLALQSARAYVHRLGRRLGTFWATAAILLVVGPAWVGYNGLELWVAPVAMIAVQALALHYLLREYQHRILVTLVCIVLTLPLAYLVFSALELATGDDSFEHFLETAPPVQIGAIIATLTIVSGVVLLGFPLGMGASLAGVTRSTRRLLVGITVACIVAFVATSIGFVSSTDEETVNPVVDALILQMLIVIFVIPLAVLASVGSLLGYRLGWTTARIGRPAFDAALFAGRYLQPLIWPSVGFFVGYLAIAVVFAGYHATALLLSPEAYRLQPEGASATMGDFLYFSLMTMLTMDNGKIQPIAREAKLLVSIHALLATGWTLIFFAAVTAYVQRFWARIDREDDDEEVEALEASVASLERVVAAEQERASSRHRELLQEIRGPRGGGTGSTGVPADALDDGDRA